MTNDNIDKRATKAQKPIERVTIIDTLKEKLLALTTQANGALKDIATVTKSDVINLILAEHSELLSANEIQKLKETHIDQVKLAAWLEREVKSAKRAGRTVSLKELLDSCESVVYPKKPRKPRKKKNIEEPSVVQADSNLD